MVQEELVKLNDKIEDKNDTIKYKDERRWHSFDWKGHLLDLKPSEVSLNTKN